VSFEGPWQSIRAQQAREHQTATNSARHATSFAFLRTTGSGELRHPEVLAFDCTFIHQPSIAHGFTLDGDTLIEGSFPRVTAGVHRWRRNRIGHYTGAWVYVVVDVPGGITLAPGDLGYALGHTFTFAGTAMKDLPDHLFDE
jgi:hypothetical protein